jgi:HTH-type transcriptional regulator/antitoxin HigA
MRNVSLIRTDAEYAAAARELAELRRGHARAGVIETERTELLGVLLRAYEARHAEGDPVDTIKLYLARLEKTPKDLEAILKCTRHRVWEILNRKRALSLPQIRALVNELGIPSDRLIVEYPVARTAGAQRAYEDQPRSSP